MQTQSAVAGTIRCALRPPRAGAADGDRSAMRAALQRVLDEYRDDAQRLRSAGYARPEDFCQELRRLVGSSAEELSANVLAALFGHPGDGRPGRLGRLLDIA